MNKGDNPPIGIVLCADKSDTLVEYTLLEDNKQIFAAKYLPYMPTKLKFTSEFILGKQSGDAMCLACAYRGMGEILAALDNGTGAKEHFQKSMEEFKQAEDYKGMQEVEEMMHEMI